MAVINIDGFNVYSSVDGRRAIIVESNRIDECMRIYVEHRLDGVSITTWRDYYTLQNIDFLYDYPDIKRISISDGIKDINAIQCLHDLEWTITSGKKRKIDFSNFLSLSYFNGDWSSDLINMDRCKNLEDLILRGYNPQIRDCSSLPNVVNLKRLELVQSTICTLNGLEKFDKLQKLAFYYCSKLENLCCLESSAESLTYSFFDHCKSIKNHEYVTKLLHLYTLAYNDCGTIPSINFIKNMASLKDIRFVGTDITDGDMTPCVGLKYAAFTNKKHFSHTMEQIKNISSTV